MSPFRRILMIVGLLILAISLALLVLSTLPGKRGSESDPIPQLDLTLPTTEGALYRLPVAVPSLGTPEERGL